MAILTNSGRIAIAQSVVSRPLHCAWGSGSASWDTTPVQETISETALVAEVGRRLVSQVKYVTPDAAGTIIVPTGTFSESVNPTKHVYMKFLFDYADAPTTTIREAAVFVGTTTNPALPAGQMYFNPAVIVSAGTLLVIQRFTKVIRSNSVRQQFEFVVTF